MNHEMHEYQSDVTQPLFSDEYEVPEAPETWSLDDFGDVLGDFDFGGAY